MSHADLDKNLKSLLADEYVKLEVLEKKLVELSEEGLRYANNGTPEFIYASALELSKATLKSDVEAKVGAEIAKIGFSKAMQRKWIQLVAGTKDQVERIAEALDDSERT